MLPIAYFIGIIMLSAVLVHSTSVEARSDAFLKIDGVEGEAALSDDVNVCDGVTCPDGSCAATRAECGVETTISPDIYAHDDVTAIDSVCSMHLCPDGTCVSDAVWCGVDFDFSSSDPAAAIDSVCNGYLCNDGTCVSDAVWCDIDLTTLPGAVASCSERAPVRCGDGSCGASPEVCRSLPDVERPDQRVAQDAVEARPARCPADASMRCADGSCVASLDLCPRADREPDYLDTDDDSDSVPTRAGSHNSSRSNETEGRGVGSDDDDVIDEDDDDVIEPAQDYNSTRSNKRENSFFDPDDDAEDDESGVATVSAERLATIVNDPPTVRCGAVTARTDGGGQLWCWGSGVRAAAVGDEDEDGSLVPDTRALQRLSVRGNEVRAWSEQERAEFEQYRATVQERSTPETALADITRAVLENDRIHALEVTEDEMQVEYEATLRLFGLFPLSRTVEARTDASGEIHIDYPWYSLLSTTPDSQTIRTLILDTMSILVRVPA